MTKSTDSHRRCRVCNGFGNHHTDRYYTCNRCQDTGWLECDYALCDPDAGHGGYCGCIAGANLQIEDAG